jgi:hypothetical protein
LRVLEQVGILHGKRTGREMVFVFDPQPIKEMRAYLGFVAEQWDQALARLRSFIEDETKQESRQTGRKHIPVR